MVEPPCLAVVICPPLGFHCLLEKSYPLQEPGMKVRWLKKPNVEAGWPKVEAGAKVFA
jgi:hypothetical protein